MTFSGKSLSSAFLVVSAAFSTLAMAEGSPVVWTAPSMHRVGMSEAAGSSSEVNLSAARGEYESFQIVANGASNGLGNVNVTISDLQGPGGQVIPRTSFTLYREKYMHVTSASPNWKGSNQPMGPGWYPDALIPFTDPDTGKPLSGASSDCGSVRRQSRQQPADLGGSSGAPVGRSRENIPAPTR